MYLEALNEVIKQIANSLSKSHTGVYTNSYVFYLPQNISCPGEIFELSFWASIGQKTFL